ncbi:MAG: LolA family protein [Terriglobales bacterium]
MKTAALALALLAAGFAQQPAASLAAVLQSLDAAAPGIHAVAAHAELEDYTALVHDSSRSTGMMYFERSGHSAMYALDLTQPKDAAMRVVLRDQALWRYVPAAKEVTKYPLGAKQGLVDQFLLLGMGASGEALTQSFAVSVAGTETLDGAPTVKLTLLPRAASVAAQYPKIELWYDTRTWVAAEEQLWQPGGDYHRVHFTQVKLNPKLDRAVFSTTFPGAAVVISQ